MREQYRLREIEKLIGTQFKKILIPSATEVRDKKLIAFTDTIKNCEIEDSIFDKTVLDGLEPLMELSKEELALKQKTEREKIIADSVTTYAANLQASGAEQRKTAVFVMIGSAIGLAILYGVSKIIK
jgi:hypothetical protein